MDVYSWFRRRKAIAARSQEINSKETKQEDGEFFGITDQLIDLIKSFTLDTFKNFPLPDEEGDNCGDDGTPAKSGNIQKDLSDWQERHATLILSKVKVLPHDWMKSVGGLTVLSSNDEELSQIRFRLCPGYLKERDFWRIYFTLVKNIVAEYELHAIRLQKLKQMTGEKENEKKTSACEVEMLETKQTTMVAPANLVEHNSNSLMSDNRITSE